VFITSAIINAITTQSSSPLSWMSRRPAHPNRDKIIELGICPFEYDRQNGRICKVLGSWEWLEDPGTSIPLDVTKLTGISDEMVAGHRIDDRAVNDLLGRVVLVIAHHSDFDRRFSGETASCIHDETLGM
jgi:DNA polymerase-3 subunit epsilon